MVTIRKPIGLSIIFHTLFFYVAIRASPLENGKGLDTLNKRQGSFLPGLGGIDPSGIDPEDENFFQILADGTGPLRSGNLHENLSIKLKLS